MASLESRVDVCVIGGGIGGTALAGYLARAGLAVTVLERTTEFSDRVRGEWLAPWGVAEAKRVGLYDAFRAAGGHHLTRHIGYDELFPAEVAEANTLPLGGIHPDAPGPLTLQHVVMQNVSLDAARQAGANVIRGVSQLTPHAGEAPRVSYRHDGVDATVSARWLIGADGRGSATRRAVGIALNEAPLDHLMSGMLIEDAEGWPDDLQAIGKVGDIQYLVFPQGGGRIRLYTDYALTDRGRFSGEEGARAMLDAFDMAEVPHSGAIARANPAGPCRAYPSQDAWVDVPYAEGVTLVGDAAGYNDPILGQGLSIALRDVRMVGEIMTSERNWRPAMFEPYAEERRERLRRLRFIASFVTTLGARFEPEDVRRRKRAFVNIERNDRLQNIGIGAYLGPERLPAECFTPEYYEAVFGSREHLVA